MTSYYVGFLANSPTTELTSFMDGPQGILRLTNENRFTQMIPSQVVNLDYGTRSFVCTYCGKNFGSKSGMASHEANHHTGQFRHKCHLCGKGFFNKHNLTVHLR